MSVSKLRFLSLFVLFFFSLTEAKPSKGETEKTSSEKKLMTQKALKSESKDSSHTKEKTSSKNTREKHLKKGKKRLGSILSQYRKSHFFYVKFNKVVYLSFLEIEKKSQGELFYAQGKMRLEIKKPEPLLVILDGKSIWMEQSSPKAMNQKPRVIQMDWNEENKNTNLFFFFLFSKKTQTEKKPSQKESQFEILAYSETKNEEQIEFKLKSQNSLLNTNKIELVFDSKRKKIQKIGYKDELNNLITYHFSQSEWNKKIPMSKFLYTPPQGVEVLKY